MLFGTSGIRGLYNKEITEELALKIGNLFADKSVVVARDTRITGESLAKAVISGVLSRGKDSIYLGIVPTPTLALATKKFKCNGIMLTASHNPPEYNGLKLFSNGKEISRAEEKEIELKFERNHYDRKSVISPQIAGASNENVSNPQQFVDKLILAEWNKIGTMKQYTNAIEDHKNLIKKLIDINTIKKSKPKVVVDPNGAGAVITVQLLKELGCEVLSINDSLEGFTRNSEPNKENLSQLAQKVKETHSDLGIGHDGDADRAVVVDETGEVLPLDVQLAVMIENELGDSKKGSKIISTAEASLIIREVVEQFGAKLLITPVGSLYVSELIEKENALFGGEPCGEYVFSKGLNVPDGILTAAKFVELFCRKGKLSELKKKYKTYPMLREKFKCDNSKKYKLVDKIKEVIVKTQDLKDSRLRADDGIRVDEENGWFLIRASGTEPYIRLTMEYKEKPALDKKYNELKKIISKETNPQSP